jgi:hypothetical protein
MSYARKPDGQMCVRTAADEHQSPSGGDFSRNGLPGGSIENSCARLLGYAVHVAWVEIHKSLRSLKPSVQLFASEDESGGAAVGTVVRVVEEVSLFDQSVDFFGARDGRRL